MDTESDAARRSLQERVCSVCTDRLSSGECGLSNTRECPFDKHLQQIVGAISRVDSTNLQDYINAIREDVCSICEHNDEGKCEHRDHVDCALDAYIILVIEAIENARARAGSA